MNSRVVINVRKLRPPWCKQVPKMPDLLELVFLCNGSSLQLNALVRAAAALALHSWQIPLAGMTLFSSSMYSCIPRCPCAGDLRQCSICWEVIFLLKGCLQKPVSRGSLQQEFADLLVFRPMILLTFWRTVPCTTTLLHERQWPQSTLTPQQ